VAFCCFEIHTNKDSDTSISLLVAITIQIILDHSSFDDLHPQTKSTQKGLILYSSHPKQEKIFALPARRQRYSTDPTVLGPCYSS